MSLLLSGYIPARPEGELHTCLCLPTHVHCASECHALSVLICPQPNMTNLPETKRKIYRLNKQKNIEAILNTKKQRNRHTSYPMDKDKYRWMIGKRGSWCKIQLYQKPDFQLEK